MKIRLLKNHRRNGFLFGPGAIIEAPTATAAFLLRLGRAEDLEKPPPAPAPTPRPRAHPKRTSKPNPNPNP